MDAGLRRAFFLRGFIVRTGPQPEVYLLESKEIRKAWVKKTHQSTREKSITTIALGDFVQVDLQRDPTGEDLAVIHTVEEPCTMLTRESIRYPNRSKIIASNLDQVFIVLAATYPRTAWGMIDRMTVAALSGGLQPILLINKWDQQPVDESEKMELEDLIQVYRQIFPVISVSAKTGYNLDQVRGRIKHKKSIFIGLSGVGKSALVKTLTGIELRLGSISQSSKKGTHTTRESQLYLLEEDTWIADVPGIKLLGFIQTEDPIHHFPELQQASLSCKFSNCKHDTEPGCNVQELIQKGSIDRRRLESYKKLKDELEPSYFKDRVDPEETREPRERPFGSKKHKKR